MSNENKAVLDEVYALVSRSLRDENHTVREMPPDDEASFVLSIDGHITYIYDVRYISKYNDDTSSRKIIEEAIGHSVLRDTEPYTWSHIVLVCDSGERLCRLMKMVEKLPTEKLPMSFMFMPRNAEHMVPESKIGEDEPWLKEVCG